MVSEKIKCNVFRLKVKQFIMRNNLEMNGILSYLIVRNALCFQLNTFLLNFVRQTVNVCE